MDASFQGRKRRRELSPEPDMIRDWQNLPPELVHRISKKLGDLAYFIRFRAVCIAWRSAAPLSDPPLQLPRARECNSWEGEFVRFYSITSGKTYEIPFPSDQYHLCTHDMPNLRYLLATKVDPGSRLGYYLLNPITHKSIPFLNVPVPYRPLQIGLNMVQNEEDIVIMSEEVTDSSHQMLRFCKLREEEWKTVEISRIDSGARICYKGMWFIDMDNTGCKSHRCYQRHCCLCHIPAPVFYTNGSRLGFSNFIESFGELLGVRWGKGMMSKTHIYGPDVCKLDDRNSRQSRWVKTNDIGDKILFLLDRGGFSFRSSEVGEHKGNCIYYKACSENLMRYDIKERTAKKVFCSLSLCSRMCWFVPGI
jgi:Protein of unknown function (DUF295)